MILTENITKIYDIGESKFTAIKEVSLRVAKGEFLAIMGASGSGKSTFLNLLGCLDIATSGKYYLNGTDTSILTRDELAEIRNSYIGFVFQNFNLLQKTSALENVMLPFQYKKDRIENAEEIAVSILEKVGLKDKLKSIPTQLSGGQQQRVAFARALVDKPQLILADEPTGNLDSRSGAEIMDIFTKINAEEKITIVIVTHEPDIAKQCRRKIVFKDGEIIEDKKT